ncbi:polymer-forming cytoskeletal protein [Pontibacter sp. G13]|uniref:bactofilin family protein n=1 Tax=Pontibacter sp. G13 TaxID=3074898 RepID=UPI00288AF677|nr:polymer-forming cytoskeletal protein [Pontibacter sp. G13]WNJ21396.1 polymer-forming cytoskeletal protein [Pontibacter sp. G13]
MFGTKNENSRPKVTSSSAPKGSGRSNIISEGTVVVGNINAEGDLRVEGKVKGTLVCNSKLVVSATGYIEGNVDARVANIEGEIKGNVVTRELLTIDKTGKIFGDIFTQKLVVQMGAIFTGNSKMAEAAKEMLTQAPQRAKDLLAKNANSTGNNQQVPQKQKIGKAS